MPPLLSHRSVRPDVAPKSQLLIRHLRCQGDLPMLLALRPVYRSPDRLHLDVATKMWRMTAWRMSKRLFLMIASAALI